MTCLSCKHLCIGLLTKNSIFCKVKLVSLCFWILLDFLTCIQMDILTFACVTSGKLNRWIKQVKLTSRQNLLREGLNTNDYQKEKLVFFKKKTFSRWRLVIKAECFKSSSNSTCGLLQGSLSRNSPPPLP